MRSRARRSRSTPARVTATSLTKRATSSSTGTTTATRRRPTTRTGSRSSSGTARGTPSDPGNPDLNDGTGDGVVDYSGALNPQCSDGFNNDGDAWTDYPNDPGCTSIADDSESPNPQCSDGFNNDGDAWTDYPNDPGCTSYSDPTESPNPQCSDGVDNDSDGRTDYPNDPGCTSRTDNYEGCPPTVGTVALCLTPTTLIQRVTVHDVDSGDPIGVAGYVEIYRFTLPNGTITSLPCVRLLVGGAGVNPCGAAGGVFVSRIETLVGPSITPPDPRFGEPIATVGICNADLELTVNNIGVNSTPAYAIC